MKTKKTTLVLQCLTLCLVALSLLACQQTARQEVITALPQCDVELVQHYLGQSFENSMVTALKNDAKADQVRVLYPTTPETRDYRHERLNVRVSEQGKIVSLGCG